MHSFEKTFGKMVPQVKQGHLKEIDLEVLLKQRERSLILFYSFAIGNRELS